METGVAATPPPCNMRIFKHGAWPGVQCECVWCVYGPSTSVTGCMRACGWASAPNQDCRGAKWNTLRVVHGRRGGASSYALSMCESNRGRT
eukprot:1223874-Lingulodinium_polyedra.AAC.1